MIGAHLRSTLERLHWSTVASYVGSTELSSIAAALTIPSLQYRKDSQWIKPCNADFDEAYWGPMTPPVPAATL